MSPEAQRIAIAEAIGWRFHAHREIDLSLAGDRRLKEQAICRWCAPGRAEWQLETLPDFLNDLNAMHEAEKVLNREQQMEYITLINRMRNDVARQSQDWYQLEPFWQVHSTAGERAEAFLKCLEAWKP